MEEFKVRLLKENEELDNKIKGLKRFVEESPVYNTLPSDLKNATRDQLTYMRGYRTCLNKRIDILIPLKEIQEYVKQHTEIQ